MPVGAGARRGTGRGSIVSIEIPGADAEGLSATEGMDRSPAENGGDELVEGATRRVLYVEDNPSNLFLVQAILARRPNI